MSRSNLKELGKLKLQRVRWLAVSENPYWKWQKVTRSRESRGMDGLSAHTLQREIIQKWIADGLCSRFRRLLASCNVFEGNRCCWIEPRLSPDDSQAPSKSSIGSQKRWENNDVARVIWGNSLQVTVAGVLLSYAVLFHNSFIAQIHKCVFPWLAWDGTSGAA